MERVATVAVHHIVDAVAVDAEDNIAARSRSGELLRSFRVNKRRLGGDLIIGTDHWRFIEYGTNPHEITPDIRRALYWSGAEHPVRRVQHPGTPEYAPMRRALRQRRNVIV